MKDFQGQELQIKDKVVFATKNGHLEIGNIAKFYDGLYKGEECSVVGNCGTHSHITNFRIYKLKGE